jgi:hypothetical protein
MSSIRFPEARLFTDLDPDLQPYVAAFSKEYGIPQGDLTGGFVITSQFLGRCSTTPQSMRDVFSKSSREILIDRNTWVTGTELDRELVIYHELGHCLMNLRHNDNTIKKQGQIIAESLMYSNDRYDWAYPRFHTYYIEQLRQAFKDE